MSMHPITRQWEAIGIGLWAGDCVIALDRVYGGLGLREGQHEHLQAAVHAAQVAADVKALALRAYASNDPRLPALAKMNIEPQTARAIEAICSRALAGGDVTEADLEIAAAVFTDLQHRCMVQGRGERPFALL